MIARYNVYGIENWIHIDSPIKCMICNEMISNYSGLDIVVILSKENKIFFIHAPECHVFNLDKENKI